MSDKEAGMPAQSNKAAVEAADVPTADTPPKRPGEEYRREWADANGVDPSQMHELHHPGGWVDRFDGNGWVQEGGY